jgi:hypothetical protein
MAIVSTPSAARASASGRWRRHDLLPEAATASDGAAVKRIA